MSAASRHQHRPVALRGRVLPWLAAIVFLLQMLAATEHHHEPAAKSHHCIACTLHAQPYAGPPDLAVAPAPVAWTLLRTLSAVAAGAPPPFASDYLRPPPQAPPIHLPS
jgi:hypothetical protein